jgi:hypothetical protein
MRALVLVLLLACKPKVEAPPPCRDGCDGGDAVSCERGVIARCRGPKGCTLRGCDTSRGEAGDPCDKEGTFTCGDHAVLRCDGSSLVLASACRGGCVYGEEVRCDDSIAQEGDACDTPGQIACGDRVELRCLSGKFARARECRTSCTVDGGVYCD